MLDSDVSVSGRGCLVVLFILTSFCELVVLVIDVLILGLMPRKQDFGIRYHFFIGVFHL